MVVLTLEIDVLIYDPKLLEQTYLFSSIKAKY